MTDRPRFAAHPLPPLILGGSINLLAGASGVGKTALLAQWCKAFRDQTDICGYPVGDVSDVYLISADRSYHQSTSKWFELAGIPDIQVYSLQDDLDFPLLKLAKKDITARVSIFGHCLDQLKPTPHSIVCVDPMSLFFGGNLNDYDTCLVACSLIRRAARHRLITLIGLAHSAKQLADPKRRYLRLQDRISGSAALFGYSDTQIYLASPEEMGTSSYTLYIHPHHVQAATFEMQRDPATGLFLPPTRVTDSAPLTFDDLADEDEDPRLTAQQARASDLLQLISAEPPGSTPAEICTAAEQHTITATKRTILRWLDVLVQTGQARKAGHGRYVRSRPS